MGMSILEEEVGTNEVGAPTFGDSQVIIHGVELKRRRPQGMPHAQGKSIQFSNSLVPHTMKSMALQPKNLK